MEAGNYDSRPAKLAKAMSELDNLRAQCGAKRGLRAIPTRYLVAGVLDTST